MIDCLLVSQLFESKRSLDGVALYFNLLYYFYTFYKQEEYLTGMDWELHGVPISQNFMPDMFAILGIERGGFVEDTKRDNIGLSNARSENNNGNSFQDQIENGNQSRMSLFNNGDNSNDSNHFLNNSRIDDDNEYETDSASSVATTQKMESSVSEVEMESQIDHNENKGHSGVISSMGMFYSSKDRGNGSNGVNMYDNCATDDNGNDFSHFNPIDDSIQRNAMRQRNPGLVRSSNIAKNYAPINGSNNSISFQNLNSNVNNLNSKPIGDNYIENMNIKPLRKRNSSKKISSGNNIKCSNNGNDTKKMQYSPPGIGQKTRSMLKLKRISTLIKVQETKDESMRRAVEKRKQEESEWSDIAE